MNNALNRRYNLHISFSDGSNPWVRFNMTREEYSHEMERWKLNHIVKINRTEESSFGTSFIFATAREKRRINGHTGKSNA